MSNMHRLFVPNIANLLSTRRGRRGAAWVILLVWLFAIASGVVNACLLDMRGTHVHGASATQERPILLSSVTDDDSHGLADHTDETSDINTPCLKFCDDETNTTVKEPSSLNLPDVILAKPIAAVWILPTAVALKNYQAQALRSFAAGPPVRLRYSRLAL